MAMYRRNKNIVNSRNSNSGTTNISQPTSTKSTGKAGKYRQLSSNLTNLVQQRYDKIAEKKQKQNWWNVGLKLLGGAIDIVSGGVWGTLATEAVGGFINAGANEAINKYQKEALTFEQMAGNVQGYLSSLASSDTTVESAMNSLYGSLDEMRTTYGSGFVDQLFDYYLIASGMTPDSYSLLTNNFKTFDRIGYGQVSEEDGAFDSLTNGDNYFDNTYAQITMNDIAKIHDNLVMSLYGANTSFATQLRGYEKELRSVLEGSLAEQNQILNEASNELTQLNINARTENLGYEQNIGSAEAGEAVSGMRGGTSYNNSALARLSRDLGLVKRAAELTSFIGRINYQIENAQRNTASTAFNLMQNQIVAQKRAEESAVIGFNAIGRSLKSAERQRNYYVEEASDYQRQYNELYAQVSSDEEAIYKAVL